MTSLFLENFDFQDDVFYWNTSSFEINLDIFLWIEIKLYKASRTWDVSLSLCYIASNIVYCLLKQFLIKRSARKISTNNYFYPCRFWIQELRDPCGKGDCPRKDRQRPLRSGSQRILKGDFRGRGRYCSCCEEIKRQVKNLSRSENNGLLVHVINYLGRGSRVQKSERICNAHSINHPKITVHQHVNGVYTNTFALGGGGGGGFRGIHLRKLEQNRYFILIFHSCFFHLSKKKNTISLSQRTPREVLKRTLRVRCV